MGRPPESLTTAATHLVAEVRGAADAKQALDVVEAHGLKHGESLMTSVLIAALLLEIRGRELLETDFDEDGGVQASPRAVRVRSGRAR
jgi:hypothetical protein